MIINGDLDSDFIEVGSKKSSDTSSLILNQGDVMSNSIAIQSGSTLNVQKGTIDLFDQDHEKGGSFELHGIANAQVMQGSQANDDVLLASDSQLTLSGSTSTNLGECSGGGCDASINLDEGNDFLVTNQASVSIPSGFVIDGGDIGSVVDGVARRNQCVSQRIAPTGPGTARSQLKAW